MQKKSRKPSQTSIVSPKLTPIKVETKKLRIMKNQSTNSNRPFNSGYFLADGGLETTLIFHEGIELRHFAAFELLNSDKGKESLKKYYSPYLELAAKYNLNYILETPTWRSNPDWGKKLGYTKQELNEINYEAVLFLRRLQEAFLHTKNIYISGAIGPRGDGYKAENCMTANEARDYHMDQVNSFALADADFVSAMTMNYSDEAIGVALAAKTLGVPVVISFTVETDGKLPNGESIQEAIEKTDEATESYAEHFMINCAHPRHFSHVLNGNHEWKTRIRGVRANASTKSHAELDEAVTLDTGNKCDLALAYTKLDKILPDLRVIGGCCGTDHRHMEEICRHLFEKKFCSEPSMLS